MRSYKELNIQYQGGDLELYNKKLESLDGCPQHITGHFNCSYNELTSLVGGPQKVDDCYICYNNQLTDLVGCASHIGGKLLCDDNQITSLAGIHKIIKSCKQIKFDDHKIIEGGIGLLMIGDLTQISSDTDPFIIIEKYLGKGTKGMMECSKELKARGYEQYAKL